MYYWGYFRNTDTSKDKRGQLYKVVIITDFQNSGYSKRGGELKLTANPFTVSYQSEDDNLFKPYKCSTATVSFYLDKINKDLYSVRGNDIYVSLLKLKDGVQFKEHDFIEGSLTYPCNYDYKEYTLEWVGFATPNAYNQSFVNDFDIYEMECQDALSTLQYYNYKPCKESVSFTTIGDILKNVIASIKIYKHIYITDNIKSPVTDWDNQNLMNYLYINERNFYNEDDEPLKMLNVLEYILQYLSLTIVPFGDSLYIVDYNAISEDVNTYHKLTYESDVIISCYWQNSSKYNYFIDKGMIELKHNYSIEEKDIATNDINYSLSSTYNKVKVTDNFYFKESSDVFSNIEEPTIFSTIKTYNTTVTNSNETGVNQYSFNVKKSDSLYTHIVDGNNKSFMNKYYGFNGTQDLEINTYWWQDKFSCEWIYGDEEEGGGIVGETFDWVSSTAVDIDNSSLNFDRVINYVGALVVDEAILENDLSVPNFKKVIYLPTGLQNSKSGGCAHYQLPTYQFIDSTKAKNQKVIDFTLKNQLATKEDYIIINGDFNFYTVCAPLSTYAVQGRISNTKFNYIWAKLECNSKCWNGSEWVASDTMFRLPVNNSSVSNSSIKKNVGFNQGLTVTGYGVKVPVESIGVVPTDIKLTLYRIFGLDYYNQTELTVLKNFEFDIVSPVKNVLSSNVSNSEYTNIINNSALEEFNDISLNITTHCGKDKDYSSVYVYTAHNPYKEERYKLNVFHNLATGELLTAEEHIISNICRQYALPNINLNISLHNNIQYKPYSLLRYRFFEGSKFVIDAMSINYADNINSLKLVEKLNTNKASNFERKSKKRDYKRNGDIINNAQQVKKDGQEIKHTLMTGNTPTLSYDNKIYLKKLGDTELTTTDLDLGAEKYSGYPYAWFNINGDGELIFYYPNNQTDLSAYITDDGILEVKHK